MSSSICHSENYKNRCKARRQKSQDYSNSLHKTTKQILCEPGYTNEELQDKTLAEQTRCDYYNKLSEAIFTVNRNKEGKEAKDGPLHCKEEVDTTTEEILKHLAVCEHLRWEASHILMGYRPTNGKTCDLMKLHDCIKPYNDLEEYIKHYDWLVVKNSLICVEKEEKAPAIATEKVYTPHPIATDDVCLPNELDELAEQIAENVHEVWAENRIKEGWTYGKRHDDNKRQHPCLIPYVDLPEEEKAYDRNTAFGTLRLITKLGFKITRKRV